jgi:GTP cyclohydrolase I
MKTLTWADIDDEVNKLVDRLAGRSNAVTYVYGVPQGGAPVAIMVAARTGLKLTESPVSGTTLIVDDLVDTGATLAQYHAAGYAVDTLYRKPWSPLNVAAGATLVEDWLAFPWERDEGEPTDAVVRILQHIGEDPTRDGLKDTPKRVLKAYREMTAGYDEDPADILATTFDVSFDEMIVLTDVPYTSLCEHHMLTFTGTATIGYIPKQGGRVVGLSKLARLLDCYARRLQVQERLTNQIADAIVQHLDPLGVGVVIRGNHSCMCARGIKKRGEMVTSRLVGKMRDDGVVRAEFLSLAQRS